jgi:hypothetical protein
VRALALALLLVVAVAPVDACAELKLPRGFVAHVYLTGDGFDAASLRNVRGIPSSSTLALDEGGVLYVARTGRRYLGGESEDLWPIYRIPPGGATLTPATEKRFLYGPPLPNAQIAVIRGARELFLTTFDRERAIGVLYRVSDGRPEMLAGGTPERGAAPVLKQPEAAAADSAGNLFVADRQQGVVVKLDQSGQLIAPRWFEVARPRVLAIDQRDHLWVGADGTAEAPWQRGPGEIWRISPDGQGTLLLRGPVSAGIALSPAGHLFVADRQSGTLFALTSEGRRVNFATFSEGDAPRALTFAPDTPATRQAGIAGHMFLVKITRGAWPVNEVVRIAGPFDQFVEDGAGD